MNATCDLNDINSDYPQDVIYIRTKSSYLSLVQDDQKKYFRSVPEWVRRSGTVIFGRSWVQLMRPTPTLRLGVNAILKEIAHAMRQDAFLIPRLTSPGPCQTACQQILDNPRKSDGGPAFGQCLKTLALAAHDKSSSVTGRGDGATFLRHLCPVKTAIAPPSDDVIDAAEDYQYVDLPLVCVQIRIGRSATMTSEPTLNRIEDLGSVWDVVRPYINQGHHAFLATDAKEVRDLAKRQFGQRIHFISGPIVHVNKVKEGQDAWSGMKSALTDQLLLSTSCRILIHCLTGFGSRSANLRHFLIGHEAGMDTYEFRKGRVRRSKPNRRTGMQMQ